MHGLTIVCTYRDEGESGLRIKNRMGLTQLIEDIRSGHTDFGHVLVYDVSRWGRFQDIDESAYYEFVCKKSGIKVAYCAEEFDNDGSLISSIVKNIKRVMAAEYSRELSAKTHAGASRLARLGFKMGGPVCHDLERLVVDEKSQQKGILKPGKYKNLISDHVRVRPGTADERAAIRWIFEEFVRGRSQADIIRELNRRGVHWTLHRRSRWPAGWIVAIRLGTNNEAVQDYILLPSPSRAFRWLWISEDNPQTYKIEVFQTFEELARSLVRRVNKATRSTPTKRERSKAIVSGSRNGRRSRARH